MRRTIPETRLLVVTIPMWVIGVSARGPHLALIVVSSFVSARGGRPPSLMALAPILTVKGMVRESLLILAKVMILWVVPNAMIDVKSVVI